jgi:hypothetical protein
MIRLKPGSEQTYKKDPARALASLDGLSQYANSYDEKGRGNRETIF